MVLVTHSELRFAVTEPMIGRERRQPLAWWDACPRQATSNTCAVVTMNFCQVARRYYRLSPAPGVMVLVTHSELRFAVSEPVLGRERRQPLAWRDASCPRQATSDTCAVVTMNFCQVALMTLWHLRCYLVRHHKEHLQLAGHCADRDLTLSSPTPNVPLTDQQKTVFALGK